MAASELEMEPDLNKAPPHLEGELLKQKSGAVLRGWKKYFFIVIEDHLKYYKKKEDYESGKDPISVMRLSQVRDVTEAVFQGVPKKHHLNCGFSLNAYHERTQQEQTFNLLAESNSDKRRWVHGVRYVKSYWSKRKIRETILSEEKEREILERILREEDEEDDREVLPSTYWAESHSDKEAANKSVSITVHLGNGSKVTTKVLPLDTTSDLLESIKDQLTSSATQLWLVDQSGIDTILEPQHCPAGLQAKAHRFYALGPSERVLVLFSGEKGKFESIAVSSKATAEDVINNKDVSVQLDLAGINNRGLFLQGKSEESLFRSPECPSDVLFTLDGNGLVARLDVGHLVIKNKALHGARRTQKVKVSRTNTVVTRTTSHEAKKLEEISEEEEAQSKALEHLLQKKRAMEQPGPRPPAGVGSSTSDRPSTMYDDGWVVTQGTDRRSSEPVASGTRSRSSHVISNSPKNPRKRISSAAPPAVTSSPHHTSPRTSPRTSPTLTSPSRDVRGRSRSPGRQLPRPPDNGQASPQGPVMRRRNASRRKPTFHKVLRGQGPTIKVEGEPPPISSPDNLPLTRSRSPTIRRKTSKEAGGTNSPLSDASAPDSPLDQVAPFQPRKPLPRSVDDEDRLEKLFDRTHQVEREEQKMSEKETEDSLTTKMAALDQSNAHELVGGGEEEEEEEEEKEGDMGESGEVETNEDKTTLTGLQPMAINLPALANRMTPSPLSYVTVQPSGGSGKPVPIEVRSPNILKVIMQASETTATDSREKPMDLLSLSGVAIRNDRGAWRLVEGFNFHDPLPADCQDHTESFVLPGGIRVIFNHSQAPKRWHVLSPPTPAPSVDSRSDVDSTEHAQSGATEELDVGNASLIVPQLHRKTIVSEIGAAFLEIVSHFERTRDMEEKKRIGSDMINNRMGYIIRGQFCSALVALILEGVRPYRIQRLVVNDVWKVTSSFCQEVQSSDASLFTPYELEKLVQIMQAIGSVRALRDNNMKFRTFICLAMSRGLLCKWLQTLPELRDTLGRYYQPWAFLSQASDQATNQRLYNNMLQDLEPMNFLPFDLSIDFEIKQQQDQLVVSQDSRNHSRIPTPSSSPRPSPRPSPHSSPPRTSPTQSPLHSPKNSPPRRLSVTIKNAATGQRTNNVISAVWQPSNDNDVISEHDPRMASEEPYMASEIEEPDIASPPPPQPPPVSQSSGRERDGGMGGVGGKATSWFKKLATNLQQINAGGAITGPPKPRPSQPTPSPAKRYVKAIYKNISEDTDELSFNEGDVMSVTGQINEEWMICNYGNRTGIVPTNFVQEIKL